MRICLGFRNENWKEWNFNGLDILVPGDFNTTVDEEGNTYIYPKGDTSVAASGKMPKDGFYFDAIVRQGKIDDNNLNVEDNQEEFNYLTEENIEYFKASLIKANQTGKGVVANIGGTSIGDISQVPAPFMKDPKGIRDIEEWYISTVTRKDYLHEIF